MKIAVVGTGYVGLVTGTCFAQSGQQVTCVDIDQAKVAQLNRGESPIYEPGLPELLAQNLAAGRFHCTTSLDDAVRDAACIFLTVGTPQGASGFPDLSTLWAVVDQLASRLRDGQVVVLKSTVPVGTNAGVTERLSQRTRARVHVASNPEFLKEGAAIDDFMKPDRVVVGVRHEEAAAVLRELYEPFLEKKQPFLVMTPESAEMTKYVANAMLATRISFMNEMANLCERTGADIKDVRQGIGHDSRIGFNFTFPGAGYGGSCFGKDTRALMATMTKAGIEPRILDAVDAVNEEQKEVLYRKLYAHFGGKLDGLTVAVWGLAFKPGTDDIRDAPALVLLNLLLDHDVKIQVYDPAALANVRKLYGERLVYGNSPYGVLIGADALVVVTEWAEFRRPDLGAMKKLLARPVIIDGRNLYEEKVLAELGFRYYYIGQADTSLPASERRAA